MVVKASKTIIKRSFNDILKTKQKSATVNFLKETDIHSGNLTPLMTKTFELFSKSKKCDLTKTYILACQHILRPREKMFTLFLEFGIPRENIFVLGKAYSTNKILFDELKNAGFKLFQPAFNSSKSFDEQHRQNCNKIWDLFNKIIPRKSKVIVLDDGAMLLSIFNKRFAEIDKSIEILGIEQTSSGFRNLEYETLKFPIINVARSAVKLNKESPYIAKTCFDRLSDYISKNNITHNQFLIIGLGPIGQRLLEILQKQGKKVTGFDIVLGHKNLLEKINELKPDVIIGATGTSSLSQDDIKQLNFLDYPVCLVSVSSSDREFPVAAYRKNSTLDIHSDIKYENITFVNNGFPINFGINRRKEGIKKIEKTICLLLGSVLYLADNAGSTKLSKGFIDVPKRIASIFN